MESNYVNSFNSFHLLPPIANFCLKIKEWKIRNFPTSEEKANEGWQGEENQVKIKGKNFHFSRHSTEMLIMSTRDIFQLRNIFNLHFGSRRCCQPPISLRKWKEKKIIYGMTMRQFSDFNFHIIVSSLAIVDDKRCIFFQLCRDPTSASAYVHTESMVKCKWNADPAASHYNFLFLLLDAGLTLICCACYFLIRKTAASH